MVTEQEFVRKKENAKLGFNYLKSMIHEYALNNSDHIILFPHINHEINDYGLRYLGRFCDKVKPNKVLILCIDEGIVKNIEKNINGVEIIVKIIKDEEMNNIIQCYATFDMTNNIIMMSLTEPYGRYGEKVMEKGVGLDKVVSIGIYKLNNYI